MNDWIFYAELLDQIDFTIMAVQDFNKELRSEKMDSNRFWYSIQSFLVSVANVSKILYPSFNTSERNKIRAKRLRSKLELPDKSILKDKTIRNCFEHYDEKLDDFQSSSNGFYLGKAICDIGDVVVDGKTTEFYMRHFNPRTNILSFKGIEYNLQAVFDEIMLLRVKVEKVKNSSQ